MCWWVGGGGGGGGCGVALEGTSPVSFSRSHRAHRVLRLHDAAQPAVFLLYFVSRIFLGWWVGWLVAGDV